MIHLLLLWGALQSGPVLEARDADVVSGQVIEVQGRRLRLWGLDTPPPGVMCADDGGVSYDCDAWAREVLTELISEGAEGLAFLASQIHVQYTASPSLRCEIVGQEADGTAVGRCAVLRPNCIPQQIECQDDWYDLSAEVISSGGGAQRRDETQGAFDAAEAAACHGSIGVWGVADGAGVARRETTSNCPA